MNAIDKKQKKLGSDLKVIDAFVEVYCRGKHGSRRGELCAGCRELADYAHVKRQKCPLDPKPACKHCPIHCYAKTQRLAMREVMAYSGRRLMLRGRLDLVWHYFF